MDPATVPGGTTEIVAIPGVGTDTAEAAPVPAVEADVTTAPPVEDEALKAAEAVKAVPEEEEVAKPIRPVVEQPAGNATADKPVVPVEVAPAEAVEVVSPDKLPWWKRVMGLGPNPDTSTVAGVGPNGPLVEEEEKK